MADSLSTLYPNQFGAYFTTHIPFKAYLRITPYENGKRWVSLRDKQKTVKKIQDELDDAGWTISKPISMVPGFGIVTIVGFYPLVAASNPNVSPVENATIIHPGTGEGNPTAVMTGQNGVPSILADGRDATATNDTGAQTLRDALLADSATITAEAMIERIEYNGVMYGLNARHLP